MEQYCTNLYQQLQSDLEDCTHSKLSCNKIVESCFGIAVEKWIELREKLAGCQFVSEQKEIEFFKIIKPKFTLEIEYYNLVYHSSLFRPEEPEAVLHFWGREFGRLRRFKAENKLFLHGYQGSQNKHVPFFFLRKYYNSGNATNARIYTGDIDTCSNGDVLTASFLALHRYKTYVGEKFRSV